MVGKGAGSSQPTFSFRTAKAVSPSRPATSRSFFMGPYRIRCSGRVLASREVSGHLVGSPAFKAGGTGDPRPAGSSPVPLRHQPSPPGDGHSRPGDGTAARLHGQQVPGSRVAAGMAQLGHGAR